MFTKSKGRVVFLSPFQGRPLGKGAGVALLCSLQGRPRAGEDPLGGPADPLPISAAGSGGVGTECSVGSAGMW